MKKLALLLVFVQSLVFANNPVITLNGDSVVELYLNSYYDDPGATAFDAEDGDLSNSIVITGTYDSSTVGSYVLAYSVTDSDGNESVKIRTINVVDSSIRNFEVTTTYIFSNQGAIGVGDTVIIYVTIENTGNSNISPYHSGYTIYNFNGNQRTLTTRGWHGDNYGISVGSSLTHESTYLVTQSDLDSGGIDFTVNVSNGDLEKTSRLSIPFSGSSDEIILNGQISANNNQIKKVADPTDNLDAVNKRYVDQRTLEQTIPGQNIGDLLYWNGQSWQKLSAPQEQSTLRFCEGQLTWGTCKPFVKIEEINFCFSGEYPSGIIVKYSISNNGSTPTNNNGDSGEIVYVSKTNQNPDENNYDLMLKPYPNSDWSNYEETESIEGGGIYYFNDGETFYFRVRIISNNGVSYSETVSKTYIADSNTYDCDGDGFTVGQGDCNDDNGRIYPGADEIPDGADNNCDNVIDNYPGGGIVLDNEGNKYPYVTIGDKKWTIISADVVTYRDGTPIPQVTDATEWSNLTTGAWCYAYNENSWVRLYNWYAVAGIHDNDDGTPNKEFAPDGWRVPTFNDWSELETFLISNGYNWDHTTTDNKISSSLTYYDFFSVEGNRNINSVRWEKSEISGSPGRGRRFVNINTNFQANPWGYRSSWTLEFEGIENLALFWSSTSSNSVLGYYMRIYHDRVYTELTNDDSIWKSGGMQVRFVKD
jgi:uncharacterized protein (TIGR02145 family)